jgi:hypothetical protein
MRLAGKSLASSFGSQDRQMVRLLALSLIGLLLGACGVAETGAAAATAAAANAEAARQGLQTEARVKAQLEAATKQAAQQRNAADTEAQ